MNELQVFNNPEFGEIRIIEIGGDPWFVLRDVCNSLGIKQTADVAGRLDDDEVDLTDVEDSAGRKQDTYIINEGGLYSVILRSDKPQAKTFKRWITHDVIPTIRKTGSYNVSQTISPEQFVQVLQNQLQMAQNHVVLEKRVVAIEDKLQTALTVFSSPRADTWRDEMSNILDKLIEAANQSPLQFRGKLYKELEQQSRSNLNSRLLRLQERMKKQGYTYKQCKAAYKLDAIAADKKLRLIFEGIVKKYQALYAAQ